MGTLLKSWGNNVSPLAYLQGLFTNVILFSNLQSTRGQRCICQGSKLLVTNTSMHNPGWCCFNLCNGYWYFMQACDDEVMLTGPGYPRASHCMVLHGMPIDYPLTTYVRQSLVGGGFTLLIQLFTGYPNVLISTIYCTSIQSECKLVDILQFSKTLDNTWNLCNWWCLKPRLGVLSTCSAIAC